MIFRKKRPNPPEEQTEEQPSDQFLRRLKDQKNKIQVGLSNNLIPPDPWWLSWSYQCKDCSVTITGFGDVKPDISLLNALCPTCKKAQEISPEEWDKARSSLQKMLNELRD